MHKMEELRDRLCDELEDVSKQDISTNTLDIIDKLTHSIKSIDTILAMKGYSGDGRSYDYSYKRDSMGRYARKYSREDELKHKLEELKRNADDGSRQMIDEWLRQIQ